MWCVAVQYEEPWTYGGLDAGGSHWTLRVLDPAIVRSVEALPASAS